METSISADEMRALNAETKPQGPGRLLMWAEEAAKRIKIDEENVDHPGDWRIIESNRQRAEVWRELAVERYLRRQRAQIESAFRVAYARLEATEAAFGRAVPRLETLSGFTHDLTPNFLQEYRAQKAAQASKSKHPRTRYR
jgi:hypothetical protein